MALLKATASIITISAALTDAAAGSATDGATAPMAAPVARLRTDRRSKSLWFDSSTGLAMKRLHWMEIGFLGLSCGPGSVSWKQGGQDNGNNSTAICSASARPAPLRQPFFDRSGVVPGCFS